jgi:hypothetical protein
MTISAQMMLTHLSNSITPLMQGNANVKSVKPPLAPPKQRIKTTSQMQLMITTNMKAKGSQVSLIH